MQCLRASLILVLAIAAAPACKDNKGRRPPVIAAPSLTAAETGDRHYDRGEYEQAIAAYESALGEEAGGEGRVVFRLAMSYLSLNPGREGQSQALELLRRYTPSEDASRAGILKRLLESLETVRARLGTSQREVRRLTGELEKLRSIDLERRPPRSPK